MKELASKKDTCEILIKALYLSITAPTTKQSKECVAIANKIVAMGKIPKKIVENCKADAELMAQLSSSNVTFLVAAKCADGNEVFEFQSLDDATAFTDILRFRGVDFATTMRKKEKHGTKKISNSKTTKSNDRKAKVRSRRVKH